MKSKLIKLKLFSPVIVKGESPYENPWDSGEDYRILIEPEKKLCRNEMYETISENLDPLVIPVGFEHTIYSAVPALEVKDGHLMLVLNCECFGRLSEAQLDEFCDWWENLLSDANETLSRMQIKTKKLGRIYVHVWYLNGWSVEPVFHGGQ